MEIEIMEKVSSSEHVLLQGTIKHQKTIASNY